MSNIEISHEFQQVLQSTANVAGKVQRKVSLLALIGLIASGYVAWLLFSPESSLGWNLVKCGLVLLPVLVICFIWRTLAHLADAPSHLSKIVSDEDGIVSNLKSSIGDKRPNSIRGLISTIRTLRNQQGLGEVIESMSGIVLLVNPAFLFFAFVNFTILLVLIIIAPFIFIF